MSLLAWSMRFTRQITVAAQPAVCFDRISEIALSGTSPARKSCDQTKS